MKMTQKSIKELVNKGLAVDITTAQNLPQGLERVAVSRGKNGLNGALFRDKAGQLFAVTASTSNLLILGY